MLIANVLLFHCYLKLCFVFTVTFYANMKIHESVKRHMLVAGSEDSDLNIHISFPCVHALQLGLIPNSAIFMQTELKIYGKQQIFIMTYRS